MSLFDKIIYASLTVANFMSIALQLYVFATTHYDVSLMVIPINFFAGALSISESERC